MMIKRYPFYVGITTLILSVVILLTGLFLWISQRESKTAAIQMADRLFSEINAKMLERYESALQSVSVLAGSAARMPGMSTLPVGGGLSHPSVPLMMEALAFYDYLFSTYIGYDDGSFIQLVAVRNRKDLQRLYDAPAMTFFILRSISANTEGQMTQRWLFLNRERQVIGEQFGLDPDYDPRRRPWYVRAQQESSAFFTDPYIFSATKIPGITCAEKLMAGGGVFGADITLDRFAISLQRQRVSDNGVLFLFDRAGRIIAHSNLNSTATVEGENLKYLTADTSGDPLTQAVVADFRRDPQAMINQTEYIHVDGSEYLATLTGMKAALKFNQILASIAPVSDFTGHIRRMQQRVFVFTGLVLLVVLPLALMMSRKISGSLTRLERESKKIRQRDFSQSAPFDSSIREIHSLIKAFGLMKSTIRQLLEQQRKLFDDFTKLIAGAIDAKSSHTGGHCARVPRIAEMLADAACCAEEGPFAEFRMDTKDERWEFEVASWLHDCGKVTTPEYVVDKATKLETIYNRIHEIRMRFEVLLRDAEIAAYQKRLEGDGDESMIAAWLETEKNQIADDFAFVARCNIGGEFMADEKIERLKQIASRTWTRHLDDRIGISQEEAVWKDTTPASGLPAVEQVLADKPEHIIPRTNPAPFDDHPYGFQMDIPPNQYNLGELYNLGIRKGTLSTEDRFKINEHIIQTIIMLNKLEFPDYLANVPEFAGAHHETMIGTGYPRALKKEQMSVPARIIAIADIFEALTAADRPYKKPKTLNEALQIMSRMRDEQHIDAELFDLFLQTGVYRTYGERYLAPSQMDAVDIQQYVSIANE